MDNGYLWLKTLHLVFLVSWYAGLFYLPRLFVHHAMSEDSATRERLVIMERKLYYFVTPWMILTIVLGLWMLTYFPLESLKGMGWLHAKLLLVALLVAYHFWCGHFVKLFRGNSNPRTHVWFRWFNEIPLIFLLIVVILVVFKPF
jgi:putative membrane protein